MKNIIILVLSLSSTLSFACQMTDAGLHKATAQAAIKTINPINEVIMKLTVESTSAKLTFVREIVGSLFCVEKELIFNINEKCELSERKKLEEFIELDLCYQ